MKILQLCKKFPYPLKDGESIAVTNISKALNSLGAKVTLLVMNTSKHYFAPENLPKHYNQYTQLIDVPVNNKVYPWDAFFNLFSSQSFHVSRFISKDYENALVKLLKKQKFDVIQMETPILAPYLPIIRKYSDATVAMRAHNVEHEIWQRITDNTTWQPKKAYLQHLTDKLRRFEIGTLKDFDLLIPITKRDELSFRGFGYSGKSVVTPIGIDAQDYTPDDSSFKRPLSLSFIGSLDWIPNQEGLIWFLDNVWHKVHEKYPDLEFHIAGRHTPAKMMKMQYPNVTIHGEVKSAMDFINQHSVMVVPLLAGSGMRVKILEGMASGKVVLTTTIGVEGIDVKNRQEILLADTPEDFMKQLDFCHEHPAALPLIGSQALDLLQKEYDNLSVAKRLLDVYSELLPRAYQTAN